MRISLIVKGRELQIGDCFVGQGILIHKITHIVSHDLSGTYVRIEGHGTTQTLIPGDYNLTILRDLDA